MSGTWHKTNIRDLKKAVAEARGPAEDEARQGCPWVRSRGTFLATVNFKREQCAPAPEAEACVWRGTWREVKELVALVQDRHPDVMEVYVAGGYDGANSYNELWVDDSYEPWVSSWNVVVWTRDKPADKPEEKKPDEERIRAA